MMAKKAMPKGHGSKTKADCTTRLDLRFLRPPKPIVHRWTFHNPGRPVNLLYLQQGLPLN